MTRKEFTRAVDYWSEMVEPDYRDYLAHPTSLRHALHAAGSLFHMADWVFHTHEVMVRTSSTFTNRNGTARPVINISEFANALEQQNADFGRIRGIANAA